MNKCSRDIYNHFTLLTFKLITKIVTFPSIVLYYKFYRIDTWTMLIACSLQRPMEQEGQRPAVNFINVKRANFSYESSFKAKT